MTEMFEDFKIDKTRLTLTQIGKYEQDFKMPVTAIFIIHLFSIVGRPIETKGKRRHLTQTM